MMLSKDAIADVIEVLRGSDFYRPAHEAIYDAIIDLYGRGEPADAVTVAAELTSKGELAREGGAADLHTLISSSLEEHTSELQSRGHLVFRLLLKTETNDEHEGVA